MTRRLATILTLLFSMTFVTGQAAFAIGPDCKAEPVVVSPNLGAAAAIDPGPTNAPSGDPFAANPTTTLYLTYGWPAVTNWPDYDPGCSLADPKGAVTTSTTGMFARMTLNLMTLGGAIAVAIARVAFDVKTMEFLNPIMEAGAKSFGENLFKPLFPITLMTVAIFILWRAHRGRVAEARDSMVWAGLVMFAALVTAGWGMTLAPKADSAIQGLISMGNGSVATVTSRSARNLDLADAMASHFYDLVYYPTWKAGMAGNFGGPVVDEFAPKLFASMSLTRAEAGLPPAEKAKVVAKKQADQVTLLAQMKTQAPEAYKYPAGNLNTERLGFALVGLFGFLVTVPYGAYSAILVLYAEIIVRAGIWFFPLVAILGAHPVLREYVWKLLDRVGGAVRTAVVFGIGFSAFVAVIGGVIAIAPHTGIFWAFLIMAIMTWVFRGLTKPMRELRKNTHFQRRWVPPSKFDRDAYSRARNENSEGFDRAAYGRANHQGPMPQQQPGGWSWQAAHVAPAEARQSPGVFRAALEGARQGAVASAAAGIVTGGGVSAGAMTQGAARGAVAAGTTTATSRRLGGGAQANAAATAVGTATAMSLPHRTHEDDGNRGEAPGGTEVVPVEALPASSVTREPPVVLERMYSPGGKVHGDGWVIDGAVVSRQTVPVESEGRKPMPSAPTRKALPAAEPVEATAVPVPSKEPRLVDGDDPLDEPFYVPRSA